MTKETLFCEKNGKLHVGHTILTGFAFLASSIAWAIYDPYITKILNRLLTESVWITGLSEKLNELFPVLAEFAKTQGQDVGTATGGITLVPLFIGVIMTFDNIFGVIFQPTFGKLSDRCRSKLGKRRPFVVFGAPVSALLFAIIPVVALTNSLPATMVCIILFVFSMSLWRAPAVALMPALTPPHLRSEGNAIINLMGGVGSVIGMAAGGVVAAIYGLVASVEITAENEQSTTFPYVFLVGAVVMILGMLVIRFLVKEPSSKLEEVADRNQLLDAKAKAKAEKEAKKAEKAAAKKEKLSKGERKSLVCMLGGLFFLFCGTNAITTFFALFAAEVLGKTTGEATFMTTLFAVCSAIAAIPAGKMGKKLGRKKTILIGLIVFMTVFLLYVITGSMAVIWVALVFGGFANMLITVNTLPLVLEIGGVNKVGTFTGYYYTATFSAQIASPIVYGIVRMFTGSYLSLFVYSPVMFALSILLILLVKHGEAVPDDVIKKVKEENED
ncbi:MAG: SLC45 family MFS transporter [Ruminococcaceae bacterium]|nr:SLC45 family MFS transporter [Oscillospiraceae bacterium]